ncbi:MULTISPECIES: restriction endonuclease subunit S [Lacticaseibacillus]|uniref:restriction endonuclease subunit S n=1 Tax=Lacticaseibacillus TaxID=2759736 RepID=UPI00063DCCEB|nr:MULTISPECIES: restriction endonuclease subunit S [Lacticaseibacillus]KLI76039.1 hypothetical protein AAW28_06620 [Lacticaseibacillus casei]
MSKDDKNVPALRFKGFSDAWEKRKLGDMAKKVVEKNKSGEFKEVLTNSAENGIISQRDFFDKDIANKKSLNGYYVVRPDDFVYNPRISNSAPVGPIKRNRLNRTGIMSPLYFVFRVHNVNHGFLEQYFSANVWHHFMTQNGDTGARSDRFAIKDSVFVTMPILIPSVAEQQQIASSLQALDGLIAATQQKIADLEIIAGYLAGNLLYRTLRFNNYSDPWEKKTLGDFVKTYSGGTPKANASEYYGGDIPFIRSAEIHQTETALTITKEGLETSSAKLVKRGDILYALYGANSGDVDRSKINGAINQAILAILPDENIDPDFLCFQLRKMKRHIVGTYLQGGQGNLSGKIVTSFLIDVPKSLSEQKRIGKNLSTLANLIVVTKNKLSELKSVKRSLLANLFI